MIRSPDGDNDFFDIDIRVLQGNTLAPYLLIGLHYALRISHKRKWFPIEKDKK